MFAAVDGMMAQGLSLSLGMAGMIDPGPVGLFGFGAGGSAMLTRPLLDLPLAAGHHSEADEAIARLFAARAVPAYRTLTRSR